MSIPLNESGNFNHFVEYNSYRFNPKTRLTFTVKPNLDASRRIVINKTFNIHISSYITPRRIIPGDVNFSGIQLRAPFNKTGPGGTGGIYPYHMLATTDSEIDSILCKLTESGKTLRIVGYGMGDIYVNTIDPNFNFYIQDLHYGPHVRGIKLTPVGFLKAYRLEMDIETTFTECCSKGVDLNKWQNRIQEYTFSVNYAINERGRTNRTVSGRLVIVPPVYRGTDTLGPFPPSGLTLPDSPVNLPFSQKVFGTNINITDPAQFPIGGPGLNAPLAGDTTKFPFGILPGDNVANTQLMETVHQYINIVEDSIILPFRFKRVSRSWNLSTDKRTLTFSITDAEQAPYSIVPGYVSVSGTQDTGFKVQFIDKQFTSTISCRFILPTYVNRNPDDGDNNSKGISEILAADPNLQKQIPNKLSCYYDFVKICLQRFAVLMAKKRGGKTFDVPELNRFGFFGNRVSYLYIPSHLNIQENLFEQEIAFSLSVLVVSPLEELWDNVGTGRPAILAVDVINDKGINNFNAHNTPIDNISKFVQNMFGPNTTDKYKHADWIASQKYSTMNSRGSAGLQFNRTSDKVLDICALRDPNTPIPPIIDFPGIIVPPGRTNIIVKIPENPPKDQNNIPGNPQGNGGGDGKTPPKPKTPEEYNDPGPAPKIKGSRKIDLGMTTGGSSLNSSFLIDPTIREDRNPFNPLGPRAQEDIDLYFNQGIIDYGALDLGTITVVPFDSTNIDVNNSIEGFALNHILSSVAVPSPENSWMEYVSSIEHKVENHIVRHKLLPKQDLSPQNSTLNQNISTLLETNIGESFNLAPDQMYGESINSRKYLENPLKIDIIQVTASPSVNIILRGYGVRLNYEVVPPTLIRYGGANVVQKSRRVVHSLVGRVRFPIFAATWEIEYIVQDAPIGPLGVPVNPILSDFDDTDETKVSESIALIDTYYFSLDPNNVNNPETSNTEFEE